MSRQLRGWIGAAHPFPLVAVLALTALIALASSDGRPGATRLALMLASMLFSQLAIGWSNDYVDRDADAVYQPSKPVPSGLVRAGLMPPAIVAVLLASLIAGAALGLLPLLLLVIGTACGLGYNFGLKGTRLSALPYLIALGVLPVFVWASLDVYRDAFLGLYLVATPLPVAAHLANVLPDIDTDRAQGRRTAAVALGRRSALATIAACLLLPAVMLALSLPWLSYDAAAAGVTVAGYGALCAAALGAYRHGVRGGDVLAFRLIVLGCLVFAAGWLAAVT